ncbi:MAG TPA: hypothetical protein VHF86_01615 [Xanthomonadaceae bacterium]|nr:hypothetical protein [Xanthomonadaceae bacterium]
MEENMQNMDLGIGNLADLLSLLHDDAMPNCPHVLLALCSLKELDIVGRSATRLGNLSGLRARELFQVAADLSGTAGVKRADLLCLLDHAATALEEAEHWSALATSARIFYQRPRHARRLARRLAAARPGLRASRIRRG